MFKLTFLFSLWTLTKVNNFYLFPLHHSLKIYIKIETEERINFHNLSFPSSPLGLAF
ncbi:hypothetical protein AAZX31_14G205600 [Glycine max]